jgi:hypothetical protein
MYHTIVKRIATKNFERVNDHDYDTLLKDCAPNIHHRFGGHHALVASATTGRRCAAGSSGWADSVPP